MGQRLETFSFFHSMKSLMPASDLRLNQSHHYKVGGVWGYFLFVFWGKGGLHGEVDNKDVLKTDKVHGVGAALEKGS